MGEAICGDALRSNFEFIEPSFARSGREMKNGRNGDPGANLRPEITSLSSANLALNRRFCYDDIRNVLRQEFLQTTLAGVCVERKVNRAEGLNLLRAKIDQFSANGPKYYPSENARIDILSTSSKSETWALDTFLSCSRDDKVNSLQRYISDLISFLHSRNNFDPSDPQATSDGKPEDTMSTLVLYSNDHGSVTGRENSKDDFCGEARATPRFPSRRNCSPRRSHTLSFRRSHSLSHFWVCILRWLYATFEFESRVRILQ